VDLLRKLESTFSNGIIGIIKSLSKIIFSYVRDIGSTGVYFLDLTEPYRTSSWFLNNDDLFDKVAPGSNYSVDDYHADVLKKKIDGSRIINANDYMGSDLDSSIFALGDMDPEQREKITKDDEWKDIEKGISGFYKPSTYVDFINKIAEAFEDEGDLPGITDMRPEEAEGFVYETKKFLLRSNGLPLSKSAGVQRVDSSGQVESQAWSNFRPGRPNFGKGSNVNVTIVAFSLPNLIQFTLAASGMLRNFINICYFFGLKVEWGEGQTATAASNWFDDNFNAFKKKWNRLWRKSNNSDIFDYFTAPPKIDENTGKVVIPVSDSTSPDFYGFAIRKFFPDFFELLDATEVRLDKWTKNFKSSLSKELDSLLKNIEELIDDLEDFIQKVDDIISFFEAMQSMGLYTLQITSNDGNADIIEKMRTAENFPGVKEGDKLRLIGGFLVCYGTPNLKPQGIDFIGLVKQNMAAMNYEAAMAKYETSADKDDDPGSFDDYVRDNNFVGSDYNSALDKIFKKLF
jgi:hypothetical protein